MAKIRRIIRKQETASEAFEDQFWPVLVALFVLGGFLLSLILVYINRPWMLVGSLIVLPVLIGAMIFALSKIRSRYIKRWMQFALVISLILHLGLAVMTERIVVFSKMLRPNEDIVDLQRPREVVTPNYTHVPRRDRQQLEFERIVETDTPRPEPEELEREQPEVEEPPPRPQPTEVPEPKPTVQPTANQRRQPSETAPRQSNTLSKLTKQETRLDVARSGTAAELPETSRQSPSRAVQPTETTVQRSESQRVPRRQAVQEPATQVNSASVATARREQREAPRVETTAAATLPREVAEPKITPRADVQAAALPTTARSTDQQAQPTPVSEVKRATAPPPSPRRAEPTVDQVAQVNAAQPQRRSEQPPTPTETTSQPRPSPRTERMNAVAQSSRPETPQSQPTPRATSQASQVRPSPAPPVQRADTSPSASARAERSADAPQQVATTQPSQRRTERSQQPARSQRVTQAQRTTRTEGVTSAARAEVATPASRSEQRTASVPAAAMRAAQATRSTTADAPTTQASSAAAATTPSPRAEASQTARRQPRAQNAPTVASAPESVSRARTDTRATPSVSTMAAATNAAQAPARSTTDAVRPTNSAVARQSNDAPTANRVQAAQPTQSASPSTQVAGVSRVRAESSQRPSVNPTARSSDSPARAARSSVVATSPTAVESPSLAKAEQGRGNPSIQPSRTAVARSESGTAGAGRSANVDRALPSSRNPALNASDAAQRPRATQNTPNGSDFSPMEVAQVPRSAADAQVPNASVAATDVDVADRTGSSRPTVTNTSSSAATRATRSTANDGPVTAAAGSSQADLGPKQVVAEELAGRASGGGQPQVSFESQSNEVPRAEAGGAPSMALAATQVADEPSAPRAAGGGQPNVAIQPEATSVARAEHGDDAPVTGGPSAEAESGPQTEPSTANLVADASSARAEAGEAVIDAAQSGGGDPKDDEEDEEELARNERAAAGGGTLTTTAAADLPASTVEAATGDEASRIAQMQRVGDVARDELASTAGAQPGKLSSASQVPSAISGDQTARAEAASASGAESKQSVTGQQVARGRRSERAGLATSSTAADIAAAPASVQQGTGQPGPTSTEVARANTDTGTTGTGQSSGAAESAATVSASGNQVARAESSTSATRAGISAEGKAASRADSNAQLVASVQAEEVAPAGLPNSGGAPAVESLAQGLEVTRIISGATAPAVAGPAGAISGQQVVAATTSIVAGSNIGMRASSPDQDKGRVSVANANAGAPLRRSTDLKLPTGTSADPSAEVVQSGATPSTSAKSRDALGGIETGPLTRQTSGGLATNVSAPEGVGGLGSEYAPNTGVNSRRARKDSEEVQAVANTRFLRTESGGKVSTNTSAVVTTDAFRGRTPSKKGGGGPTSSGPSTERSIEMGLAYLKRVQMPDGRWSLNYSGSRTTKLRNGREVLNSDTAATGLALLAFQGAGYTHREWNYADDMRSAVQWLVKNQKENGDLYLKMDEYSTKSAWLYSHSIAALALCEAYGMTGDPELREPAQKSLDFIVSSQHEKHGGWRYRPGFSSDTSVTGWMMMALYSGDLAGLKVPTETYDNIRKWLDLAQKSETERHLYRYNPFARDGVDKRGRKFNRQAARTASRTMTSVGLLMRLYSGWQRSNPDMKKGADYLLQNLPTHGRVSSVVDPRHRRDTYYWYYATQVMSHMGGEYWKKWEERLHPLLVNSQTTRGTNAGSWDPGGSVPDRWGNYGGRIYVTTMNLLSLEVQYRKLPLYDNTAAD